MRESTAIFRSPMMIRTASVLLTILGLLACPVHCTSSGAVAADGILPVQGCSGCLPRCSPNHENGAPSQPTREGSEPNSHMGACLGVLGQAPRRPVVDHQIVLSLMAARPAPSNPQADVVAGWLGGNRLDPPAAWPAAGHELCIAICSFLL